MILENYLPGYNKMLRKILRSAASFPFQKQYNKSWKILQSEKFMATHLVPIKTDFN